jgi:hypothetical protein
MKKNKSMCIKMKYVKTFEQYWIDMKNILLILFCVLSLTVSSQVKRFEDVDKSSLTIQTYKGNENNNGWVLIENQNTGGSFWYIIYRTINKNAEGWYGYYVNFFSNSWLHSGNGFSKSTTYIGNYEIIMYEYYWLYNPNLARYDWKLENKVIGGEKYEIVDWSSKHVYRFWSKSPYCVFKIKYIDLYPYNYSKY